MRRGIVGSAVARWPWLAAGLVYSLLAAAAVIWTRLDGGVALVWLANGFMVAWLSLNRQREWPRAIAACLCGSAAVALVTGVGWGGSAVPLLNLAECVVTVSILRRWLGQDHYLDSTSGVAKFALIATLAPTLNAPVAAGIAHHALGVPYWPTAFNWFVGHSLGVIMMAPLSSLLLRTIRTPDRRPLDRKRVLAFATWLAPVALVAAGVFRFSSAPLLFLPLVPMTLATLRLGRFGFCWAVVIVAALGSLGTALGYGPVQAIGRSPVVQIQFLQFYFAATVFTLLPVAVLMRERRALVDRLSASESALRLMTENSGDAMLHTDAAGRVMQATGALEALIERDAEWIVGRYASEMVMRDDRDALVATHFKLLADPGQTVDFEYRVRMRDGSSKWLESRARALLDADGRSVGTISAIRDVEARKRTESELAYAASTDQLTGIANRRAFFAHFDARPAPEREGILIVADLDHFKAINDRFGHHVGDVALQTYSGVARGEVRDTDLIARIGGEEFAFFLPGARLGEGYALGDRLRASLGQASFDAGKAGPQTVTASMGMVAVAATDDAATALKRADAALYAAKEAGRDCLRLAA